MPAAGALPGTGCVVFGLQVWGWLCQGASQATRSKLTRVMMMMMMIWELEAACAFVRGTRNCYRSSKTQWNAAKHEQPRGRDTTKVKPPRECGQANQTASCTIFTVFIIRLQAAASVSRRAGPVPLLSAAAFSCNRSLCCCGVPCDCWLSRHVCCSSPIRGSSRSSSCRNSTAADNQQQSRLLGHKAGCCSCHQACGPPSR